ncbi:hybrid sensor histidine kinase/response regulator transcription factor [Paraflavitalea sp. CAU 1676]|uniref:hybrid sensor histidine kinase/response regulator transcription factor n=1 Tax=Paraflavitalea sp. CAU 1676 TaxID=3032598 RepID=UPI0023DB3D00|nr:hybrid sensor histidine kinase/response regulator transcription factor [Paraflavitalea sp. CAU 1676]MDF2191616.1 two-component regulator propeller domain-containing protein [Paraflavitalea sp. CAU 1676]
MWNYRYTLLLLSLLLTLAGRSQTAPLNFTSLSTKDGLLSNSVNAIIKDQYGMMWFATDDGLNKFDGTNFTVYRHLPGDSTSLRANEILALHEDPSGNLWIGTSGGGLSRYDRKSNAFIHYPTTGQTGELPSHAVIRGISSDPTGKLWVAQYENLFLLDPATNTLSRVDLSKADNNQPNSRVLTCVFADSKKRIWIGTQQGIYLYDSNTGRVRRYQSNPDQPGSLLHNEIRAIVEDENGVVWIGTPAGLCTFRTNGAGFDNHSYLSGPSSGLSSHEITCLAPDEAGRLWVGTSEGLNIADTRAHRVTTYLPREGNIYSLTSKWVRCVYIDQQGIYWLGTFRGGINKYDRNLNLFDLKLSKALFPQTRSAAIISAMAEAPNGDVFIGSDGGGLYRYNRKTDQVSEIELGLPVHKSHPLSVLALLVASDNKLYIGTYAWGLITIDLHTGRRSYMHQGPGQEQLNSNNIFSIKEDRKKQIWIGTNGEGINIVKEGRVVRKFTPHPRANMANEALLPRNGFVRAIEEDTAGNIWIGSHGGGINVYHPGTGTWTTYAQNNSLLPSDKVQTLHCDSQGRIWIGTFGEGLSLYNPAQKNFITYSEKDGLQNTTVYHILEDFNGLLWCSTNAGITSFEAEKKTFRNYSYHNGVQNNNFARASGIRLSNGNLMFGGLEGFNYFDPAALTINRNVPQVRLTDLKISNKSVVPGEDGPIRSHIAVADQVHLAYRQNFVLSFVALNYTLPQQNQYAYKLEGFDKDWNYTGTVNTASYTNLDPGEYTFYVKAGNNDGVWSSDQQMIRIYVHPPYWRTTWAFIVYALAACGILLYSRHIGILRIRKKFLLEQERQEAKRIQELDRLKIRFLTNLSHDFRTPISLIMGPVDQLIVQEQTENRLDKLSMIKRNARRLLNLVNQLLDFRRMEEHELSLQLSQGDLVNFLKEVTDAFMDFAERKHIHFLFHSNKPAFHAFFDHDKMERILFNLLANAFKFTLEGGNVRVELQVLDKPADPQHQWVSIQVKDSGIGIAKDKQEQIFERFFQTNSSTAILNQGTGIGLSITREFIKLQGGTIAVDSEPGQGATFTIELPLQTVVPIPEAEPALLPHITPAVQEEAPLNTITTTTGNAPLLNPADLPLLLLVEDNEDFRFYLKDNLCNSYKVIEAVNGKEGWQKALAHHPQLIVSDITMPEMDGIQLVQKLKADKRTNHIPVILLTALTAEEQQLAGLETGANDYITKPFNVELLHAKIRNLLLLNNTLKSTYSKQIKVMSPEIGVQSADEQLLQKIVHYLEENLTNPQVSVENLSKEVGMSRSSLYSKLLELTGQTPVEYIRSYRLDKAAALMEKSDRSIAEIAYLVGFSTPNYFAKSFKTKFNMLPSEFIARMRKGANNNDL